MIGDRWANILEELGKTLDKKLAPDKKNCCLLKFKNGISVQMETDKKNENILIASDLGAVTQGKYRENLFREALKANGLPSPQHGIFAFGAKTESLVLYHELSMDDLSGAALADELQHFIQKADIWKSAITRGDIPSFTGSEVTFGVKSAGGLFGLVK